MKATLEQNSGENSESIPYFVALEIVTATVDAGTVFNVPVTVELSSKGKQYSVDICGYTRKSNNIDAMGCIPIVRLCKNEEFASQLA